MFFVCFQKHFENETKIDGSIWNNLRVLTRSVCTYMEINFREVLPRQESGQVEKATYCESYITMYVSPCSMLVLGGRMTVQSLEITCGFLDKIHFLLYRDALFCILFFKLKFSFL